MQLEVSTFSPEHVEMALLHCINISKKSGTMNQLIHHVQNESLQLRKAVKKCVCHVSISQGALQSKHGEYPLILVEDMESVIDEIVAGLKRELELE